MKEGESMYLAKVIKTGNRLYVYDAFNNKLATINSEKELFENTGGCCEWAGFYPPPLRRPLENEKEI